ncbi:MULTISPECIES: hypothetical protein [Streptomyces]|uniref:Uncharacterized protein n=1 Tax=Streptomyces cadmiisoli TaxID=2184053 RepID=A0A2Z4JDU6_9ACTN|nr:MULTISPECIES: hypothetical protein [Streptomyces]AWW43304.1 hypothetical protein DN051_42790 [Streptomyces cadmiisoli]
MTERSETARINALSALIGWAERRERLASDRADLMADAWRTGTRSVAELARLARVSRDTVYADLAARGIDVSKRDEQHIIGSLTGQGTPLNAESVRALARIADAVTRPAHAHDPADPVTRAARAATKALEATADVLDPPKDQGPGWEPEDTLAHLAREGQAVSHYAHSALAATAGRQQLAASADFDRRATLHTGRNAVADAVTLTVTVPTGETVSVELGDDGTGWTTLSGDTALVGGDVDALDHLEVQAALQTLSRVITRHLDASALLPRRTDALPGTPPPRTRHLPGNND